MDEPHLPDETEPSPYLRLPWPLVAGGLLAVLGLALAAGLLANRALREQLTLPTPTPLAAVALATAPPNVAAATAVPTRLSPPTAQQPTRVLATATAVPATPRPVPATATPPAVSSPSASPRPTVDPVLADEVSQAYQHYWQVRAEALFDLDPARLPEVMAGEHLADGQRLISELRSEGRAIQTDVEHRFSVVQASPDSAQVADTYVDHSVYIDPVSHDPVSEQADGTLREVYEMNKIDGAWRVVSIDRFP